MEIKGPDKLSRVKIETKFTLTACIKRNSPSVFSALCEGLPKGENGNQ